MTIAVDLGRKATKLTNKQTNILLRALSLRPVSSLAIILTGKQVTTMLIRLHEWGSWSAPLLLACNKLRFSCEGAHTVLR